MRNVIENIELLVQKKFENEGTGHDWYHIDRVRKIALEIQKTEGGDFTQGRKYVIEILNRHAVPEGIIQDVAYIVDHVSFKGSGVVDVMSTIEGKIVQDADRIDAVGAIGIARTFAYGGSIGQPIYDPEIAPSLNKDVESYVNQRTHTVNHFYEKLLLLKDRMHTHKGREIAEERTEFMERFLDQFYMEWKGLNEK